MSRWEDHRRQWRELEANGKAVVIGMGVLTLAFVIWVFIARWPAAALFLGFGLAAVLAKRHRRVLGWASASSFTLMLVVVTVNPAPQPGAAPASTEAAAPGGPTASPGKVRYETTHVAGSTELAVWTGPEPLYGVDPVQAEVVDVIDGDTFEIAGGIQIRPLGIDSCEMSTPGGPKARDAAKGTLGGRVVLLTSEPGVDLDQFGRQLRYVTTYALGDFGERMVGDDHTTVYQGHNDADSTYVGKLRGIDSDGWNCAGPPPAPPVDVDQAYVPVPGDGNDNHHKSRFCRKHWYC